MEVITYLVLAVTRPGRLQTNMFVFSTLLIPRGMYFGGFSGEVAVGWGDNLNHLHSKQHIEGAYGNPIVIAGNGLSNQSQQNHILIDHNTFVNSTLEAHFRGMNNTMWTNNLFVNMSAHGQTVGASSVGPKDLSGHGKMAYSQLSPSYIGDRTTEIFTIVIMVGMILLSLLVITHLEVLMVGAGTCLTEMLDAAGNVVQYCDTMYAVSDQSKWLWRFYSISF